MNGETGIEVEQTENSEPTGMTEAAAAAAAFDNARSDEPITPTPEAVEPAPEPTRFAGRTEDEIATLLAEIPSMREGYRKQIDNLAGNYGKLNAAFQRLQQDTPQGEAVAVTDEDLADMSAQFPELAGMTKAALNNVLKRINLRGGTSIDPAAIGENVNKLVGERVTSEMVKLNTKFLGVLSPGWDKVIGMPDPVTNEFPKTPYREWLAQQPTDYRQRIADSVDAFEISESIKTFSAAQDVVAKKQSQNKQRLTNAIQPTGTVAARGAITEQQAAEAAFQKARGR